MLVAQPAIGAEDGFLRRLFGEAAEAVSECAHEPALPVGEAQDAVDVRLRQPVEERMIHRLAVARIFQGPAAVSLELEVLILPRGDAPVDLGDARFKLVLQFGQMRLDRLLENLQLGLDDQPGLLPHHSASSTRSLMLRKRAVAAKDIAGIDAVSELTVEEELVAIREQLVLPSIVLVEVALHLFRHPAQGYVLFLTGHWRKGRKSSHKWVYFVL